MCTRWNLSTFCAIFVLSLTLTDATLLNFKTSANTPESIKIFNNKSEDGPGRPLFVTPYIHAGRTQEARALAAVQDLGEIQSYSGFITVNPEFNSNIYFWFFPAAYNPSEAPLVLWLQGGPGGSSLFGLFTEHGPFSVDVNNNLNLRNSAWTLTHSMIYFDSPVGTGFSFTDSDDGYARNQADVARDLYNALEQFFTMFPEFHAREFYVAGESYAGKYVPSLSYKIHTENQRSPKVRMNFKGLLVIDGLTDPISMMYHGEFLYNVGLLDHHQRLHFDREDKKIRDFIEKEEWMDAFETFDTLILCALTEPGGCYFENATGLSFHYNILIASKPPEADYFREFVQLNNVRRALHVGNESFTDLNKVVKKHLREDMLKSVKPLLQTLLDAKESYKILYCSGQLDIIVANTLTDNMLRQLEWSGAKEFSVAKRKIWRKGKDVIGYVKTAKNFTHLLMRNAGHMVPTDQPKHAFDMITKFTTGTSFVEGEKFCQG